jgi:AAA+ ATPase superfamily predicted ATPase
MNSKPTRHFTDAPELHPNPVLGSLHLLFWLLFHPSAWRHYLAHHIDPACRPGFTLVDLSRAQWRTPALRRLLIHAYVVLPLLVGCSIALIMGLQGAPLESIVVFVAHVVAICLTLGIMISAVISVAAGVVGSVAVSLAYGLASILTVGVVHSIAVPTAISLAVGAAGGIAASMASPPEMGTSHRPAHSSARQIPKIGTQVGGIVIGIVVGILAVSAVRLGLTALAGLTIGLPEQTAYYLGRTLVVGASFGVAVGWRRGIKASLLGSLVTGLVYGLTIITWQAGLGGIPIGLTSGMLFGTSFGVTVVLPYVLSEYIAGPWAGAWAGALGSWGRHVFRNELPLWPDLPLGAIGVFLGLNLAWWRPLLLYPLLQAWNLVLYRLDERRVSHRPSLLPWHSAFWDELQHLPLSGLDDHLLLVLEREPGAGQAALEYLGASRQRWAAQAVQIELEARRLECGDDITAIGHAHHSLVFGELVGPAGTLLRSFSRASQDIEAALNQATAYHQRLALSAVDDRLNSLVRELTVSSELYAMRFYPIATSWRQVVGKHLQDLTEAVERTQEIDNPYIVGVPLTEQQEIFVGRSDIVARIEQLLVDQRRPPLLLYGQRRMGKTSLLRNLGRLLPSTIVPLFVDGQRIALASDYPDFLSNIAREMGKSAEQQRGLVLPELNRAALATNPFTCFNEWLDQVEDSLDAQGYRIALLALDEFEVLDNVLGKGRFDETDVLSMLRHMIQHRPRFKVMLAGSHTLQEFQRWASYLINMQVVRVGYLEEDEVRQLVEHPVKNFALNYSQEASQRVLDLTHGHPALIQLLCYEIVALKNSQEAALRRLARVSDVEAAVRRALDSGSFFFVDIQQNQVNKAGLDLLRLMATQGEGAITSREALIRHSQAQFADELDLTLDLLLRRDLIETADGGYRFQVELIRRWFEQLP